MPPPTANMKSTSAIEPHQTMRGHTNWVTGVAQLADGRRIITCSEDGSLRLWNLESGVQVGNNWRDDGEEALRSIALSPNGKTVACGSMDGKIRLWDVETKKVVARWTSHTNIVRSLCWGVDGERVVSGSHDGTIRVWNVESGDTVLGPIETGHRCVCAVIYSPDTTNIATGGADESALKIWDAKTGNLLTTIKHDTTVGSLAWTSDQKKLITASYGRIRIFDTATWQQIAILKGHTSMVYTLSLLQNDRLLASGSWDNTARLWNLDTNLPVGPPLRHQHDIRSVVISTDGMLLITGCEDNNAYVWDIHTTLNDAGFEELLSIPDMPQDGLKQKVKTQKSLMDTDATRRLAKREHAYQLPPRFLDDVGDGVQSSATPVTRYERRLRSFALLSASRAKFLPSVFRISQHNSHEATAFQSPPRRSVFSRNRARLVEVATAQDRQPLYVARRPEPPGNNGKDIQQQQRQPGSQAQVSASQTSPTVASTSTRLPPVNSITLAGAADAQSQPAATSKNPPWWARLVFFVCCASVPEGR